MRSDSREKGAQYGKNKGRKDRVHNNVLSLDDGGDRQLVSLGAPDELLGPPEFFQGSL